MAQREYLYLHMRLLRIMGISLREDDSIWYKLYSALVFFSMMSLIATIWHSILVSDYPLDVVLENLAFVACFITALVKILALYRVRKQLGRLLDVLHSDLFAPKIDRGGVEEEDLINTCNFFVKAQLVILGCMVVTSVGISILQTIIPRVLHGDDPNYWNLPYVGFALFSVSISPYFEIACFYQVVVVLYIGTGIVIVTTFISSVMIHVTYQCKIVQNFIKQSIVYSRNRMLEDGLKNDDAEPAEIPWQYLRQTIKEIVQHHTATTDLAHSFENLFNLPALTDFLGSSVGICLALFSASVLPLDERLFKQIILAGGSIFLQFITAYWGNEVILESQAIATVASEVDFVGINLRFQKSLVLIMEGSKKGVRFSVGTFAPLSLHIFVKVMKSAYSYFMILNQFSEEIAAKL